MNAYTSRALLSVAIIAAGIGLYFTSRWFPANSAGSIPYVQQTGYIDDRGQPQKRYYVTIIQRQNQLPWLIVAQPFSILSELIPFETSMSSTTTVVTVNGTDYDEIAGQTIVGLDAEQQPLTRRVPRDQSPTIALLEHGIADVRLADFVSLLPEQ